MSLGLGCRAFKFNNYTVYRSGGYFFGGVQKLPPPFCESGQSPPGRSRSVPQCTVPIFSPMGSQMVGEGDHISSRLMEELLRLYTPSWFRVMVLTPTVWKLTPGADVHEGQVCLVLEETKVFGIIIGIEAGFTIITVGEQAAWGSKVREISKGQPEVKQTERTPSRSLGFRGPIA